MVLVGFKLPSAGFSREKVTGKFGTGLLVFRSNTNTETPAWSCPFTSRLVFDFVMRRSIGGKSPAAVLTHRIAASIIMHAIGYLIVPPP
jgi:hypothetical protein